MLIVYYPGSKLRTGTRGNAIVMCIFQLGTAQQSRQRIYIRETHRGRAGKPRERCDHNRNRKLQTSKAPLRDNPDERA